MGSTSLPVECGVNRVLVRSTINAGSIRLTAHADGMEPESIVINTEAVVVDNYLPQLTLPCYLSRGETPSTPSYTDLFETVGVKAAEAGSNGESVAASYDDNELSEWRSDGKRENAWITYHFAQPSTIERITLKLTGWRTLRYPLAIYSGEKKLWEGITTPSLGYAHINIDAPIETECLTIRMLGPAFSKQETGDTAELAGGKAGELDRVTTAKGAVNLRIVEADFLSKK